MRYRVGDIVSNGSYHMLVVSRDYSRYMMIVVKGTKHAHVNHSTFLFEARWLDINRYSLLHSEPKKKQ